MKALILTAFIALIVLYGCNTNRNVTNSSEKEPIIEVKVAVDFPLKKWRIIQLYGKQVDNRSYYLQFVNKNRYAAYGGCNSLGGDYNVENDNKITFSKGFTTLVGCTNENIDHEISIMLNEVENYTLSDSSLSLNDGKKNPIAKFILMK